MHIIIDAKPLIFHAANIEAFGKKAVGVILTGMGSDGAKGLKNMKEKGAFTIAQNEETCVVFGMPKVAISLGITDRILPIFKISETLIVKSKEFAAKKSKYV